MTNETTDKLMQAISKIFEKDISQLSLGTRFSEDLNASSMKRFMLIAELEELTGKTVSYGKVKKCLTIGDAMNLLETLLEAK